MSRSRAVVDLDAIAHNVGAMVDAAAGASLCAVVKANGYGHGSVAVARTALGAGAAWLAVAQVDEARVLRGAGIEAPILLLAEPGPDELDDVVELRVRPVVFRAETIEALGAVVRARRRDRWPVHLKVDTGMRRIGCEPADAVVLARRIADHRDLVLDGTMTHLAVADEPGHPGTDEQLDRFDHVLDALAVAGIDPGIVHAANSAATMAVPRARHDMVRVGIALYGLPPAPPLTGLVDLRPALRWTSTVTHVKTVYAGEHVSYGWRHRFEAPATLATVPVGYADGYRRRLGLVGGCVLIGGQRCPIRGVVTMDQFVVECPPTTTVGDEVVLIGDQGGATVSADDLAGLLSTINYEVTCDIGTRVERVHVSSRSAPDGGAT